MLGETYVKIAREISRALNLEEREASLLETGSVHPDSWANFPHHRDKEPWIVARGPWVSAPLWRGPVWQPSLRASLAHPPYQCVSLDFAQLTLHPF